MSYLKLFPQCDYHVIFNCTMTPPHPWPLSLACSYSPDYCSWFLTISFCALSIFVLSTYFGWKELYESAGLTKSPDLVIATERKALACELKNKLNFHILHCLVLWFMQPFVAQTVQFQSLLMDTKTMYIRWLWCNFIINALVIVRLYSWHLMTSWTVFPTLLYGILMHGTKHQNALFQEEDQTLF